MYYSRLMYLLLILNNFFCTEENSRLAPPIGHLIFNFSRKYGEMGKMLLIRIENLFICL